MEPNLGDREKLCWCGFVFCFVICILLMGALLASVAKAAEPTPCTLRTMDTNPLYLDTVPVMWKKTTCGADVLGCYTLEQAKQLKQYDIDLTLQLEEFTACRTSLMDMQSIQKDQTSLLTLSAEREGQWQKLAEQRASDYMSALDDLDTCEARPDGWTYLPWFVAGAAVTAALGFGVGWYVGSR